MATKTLKIMGNGYAPTGTSASVSVTFNGSNVYTGPVPSLPSSEIDTQPDQQVEIFSFDIEDTLYGTIPMTIECTAGDLVTFERGFINSADNLATFRSLATLSIDWDWRINVEIDGIPQSKGGLQDLLTGAWLWDIPVNSTLSCTTYINIPGLEIYPYDSSANYVTIGRQVYFNENRYQLIQAAPAGTSINNTAYWTNLGPYIM